MPYLDIRDFGAAGDGIKDDIMALNAAFQAAAEREGTVCPIRRLMKTAGRE